MPKEQDIDSINQADQYWEQLSRPDLDGGVESEAPYLLVEESAGQLLSDEVVSKISTALNAPIEQVRRDQATGYTNWELRGSSFLLRLTSRPIDQFNSVRGGASVEYVSIPDANSSIQSYSAQFSGVTSIFVESIDDPELEFIQVIPGHSGSMRITPDGQVSLYSSAEAGAS